jgi:hypothetical protein
MRADVPLGAYRQLTLEPYMDNEKEAIQHFIATNYSDTELGHNLLLTGPRPTEPE